MPIKTIQEKSTERIKQIIGVMAGKGGVGKSTISVNLALAYSTMGYRVGLLDADIYGPSVRLMLGIDELVKSQEGWILPVEKYGIKVMSLSLFKQGEKNNAVRAPIANSIISGFIHDVKWGDLDILIVDFPPGTGDIQLTLMQQLVFSGALLVSTPQKASVIDVKKALMMVQGMNVPVLGVIENMSYTLPDKARVFGESHVGELGIEKLGEIPLDPLITKMGDEGRSLLESFPENDSAKRFLELAEALDRHSKESFFKFDLRWDQEMAPK